MHTLFDSFYDLERTAPQKISDNLRKIVYMESFKPVDAFNWTGYDLPNFLFFKTNNKVHNYVVRALAVHQKNIGASYWLKKIENDPKHFMGYFTGLGHCDVAEAQEYLSNHRGTMPLKDSQVESRLRGIQRRLDKHNKH